MIGVQKVTFTIAINWLLAIGAIALGLIGAFIFRPDLRPILSFMAPVLGGSAALIAAFNALESRGAQAEQSAKQAEQTKRALAFDCLHCWLNPNFYHAKKAGREILAYFKQNPSVDGQYTFLLQEPGREANLWDVLNFFEVMAVGIRMELADEEVCKRFFQTLVTRYWHTVEGCIRKRRAERENARLFQEMEWLAQRWSG